MRSERLGRLLTGASYVWAMVVVGAVMWAGWVGYQRSSWRGVLDVLPILDGWNTLTLVLLAAPGFWMNHKGHDLKRRAASRSRRP